MTRDPGPSAEVVPGGHVMTRGAGPGGRKWSALGAAILLEVSGTLALRAAIDQPWWWVLVGTGYVGSFVAMALVLRTGAPIGVVYGIWAACGVTLTAVVAAVLFGDPLTVLMGVGIAVVIGGVLLVELGAHPKSAEVT